MKLLTGMCTLPVKGERRERRERARVRGRNPKPTISSATWAEWQGDAPFLGRRRWWYWWYGWPTDILYTHTVCTTVQHYTTRGNALSITSTVEEKEEKSFQKRHLETRRGLFFFVCVCACAIFAELWRRMKKEMMFLKLSYSIRAPYDTV